MEHLLRANGQDVQHIQTERVSDDIRQGVIRPAGSESGAQRFERVAARAAEILPLGEKIDRLDQALRALAGAEEMPETLRARLQEALGPTPSDPS
jgi:hypothetical protein